MITRAQIKQFCPTAKADLIDAIIDNWHLAVAGGIERAASPDRTRLFLSSIAVETGGIRSISENLNYTTAQRIYDIFKGPSSKRRFANVKACEPYVRQPKKLAIKVYGGRLGNAPAPSEDGWLYRGAGMMQTTGRDNFRAMGFEDNPDALRDPDTAFKTAVTEWLRRKCNDLADRGDVEGVRRAINGGLNGIDEFRLYYAKAKRVWATVDGETEDVDQPELDREYEAPVDVEEEPPVPLPRPVRTYADKPTVQMVQARLWELGYTEVGSRDENGKFDGKIGKMTRTAILAFRNENDLPVSDKIDDELLAALNTAPAREMPKERAEATPAEVRKQVPEVRANWLSKAWAWFLGGGAGMVGLGSAAGEADPDKQGILRQVGNILLSVPGWMWCAVLIVVAAAIIYAANKGEKQGIRAFQDGSRR